MLPNSLLGSDGGSEVKTVKSMVALKNKPSWNSFFSSNRGDNLLSYYTLSLKTKMAGFRWHHIWKLQYLVLGNGKVR